MTWGEGELLKFVVLILFTGLGCNQTGATVVVDIVRTYCNQRKIHVGF